MRRIWLPQLVASLMLLWALHPGNPYEYYILLRWVCCGTFAFVAIKAYREGYEGWVWVLAITACLYNPLFPLRLTRRIWSFVDVFAIGLAAASAFTLKFRK